MKNSANQIEIIELLVNENINNTDGTFTLAAKGKLCNRNENHTTKMKDHTRYCCNVWHAIYDQSKV